MHFWQSIFLCESEQIFEVTRLCEQLGFEGVLVSDHLVHPESQSSTYLYSADGKPPSFTEGTAWPESWSLAAALAAQNPTLRFCTNVYILPLRHPVEVARATSSVAYFCGGRLLLGAGAGWMKEEFDILGVDWESRGRRYDECIEVIRKLYTGRYVEHHGEFFDFPRIMLNPVPAEPVPILIGGTSGPALRRAARTGDGWLGPGQTLDAALGTLAELRRLRAGYGTLNRPFNTIVPLYGEKITPEVLSRLEDAGATGIVSLPFAFTLGPGTSLAEKRAYLEDYAENVMRKFTGKRAT
ncbi:MAG: TIGR03619 family F420-dependent LLM class oxidoreductase [Gammaproteobacteria bacterium]|nr:TIGR03619 family F420-dependent LLM class oxidoreductase [Gammaproteobacteria bacterium]